MKKRIKLLLSKPRGFCAGVIRAEKTLRKVYELYNDKEKIYVRKQIVHNKFIIEDFTKKGIIFVNEVNEIPEASLVIYSAHGISPYVRKVSMKRKLREIDVTCPFVEKVHKDAIKYSKKAYHIIFIGKNNHEEAIGTTGESIMIQEQLRKTGKDSGRTYIINNEAEINSLNIVDERKIVCLIQTTLNIDDVKPIIEKLKERFKTKIVLTKNSNICYATKNRQDALKNMIFKSKCNPVFILGSQNSSNSQRLVETAKKCRVESYLIDSYKDIKEECLKDSNTIGLSSGASAPEVLIDGVIDYFKSKFEVQIEELILKEENVNFDLPHLI